MDVFFGMKIGIAGLGLIGGSLAKAFRRAGFSVLGFDTDPVTVRSALDSGAAEDASVKPDLLFSCDVIFVALYPRDIISFVSENADRFRHGSLIIDCCGIKGQVTGALAPLAAHSDFYYIGGHPMAGTERSGFEASRGDLFDSASFILTPFPNLPPEILGRAETLIKAAGFARIVVTTPAEHDQMIAFTSQLPHALACAYVKSPCCPKHRGFSAGSYRDVSRVAHINPELWAGLFLDNREALVNEIDTFLENLTELKNAVAGGDREVLTALLRQARERKDGADLEK